MTALDGPYGCSFFALVIDPRQFGGAAAMAAGVSGLRESARNIAPAEGVEAVRAPGDRARKTRQERLVRGIPFSRRLALVERLAAVGLDTSAAASIRPAKG